LLNIFFAPKAADLLRRREMTRWATFGYRAECIPVQKKYQSNGGRNVGAPSYAPPQQMRFKFQPNY
jgi:hypothetical protein